LKQYKLKPGFQVKEYSGKVNQKTDYDFLPKRFYEVKLNDTLVAKALVSCYNDEMDEISPTIDPIEVNKKYRNSGIGKSLVRLIERVSRNEGFDQVWASDIEITGSTGFWRKIGYEIDLDEAVKYLE
jgi:GNAT superfamily N-acetyltransferase